MNREKRRGDDKRRSPADPLDQSSTPRRRSASTGAWSSRSLGSRFKHEIFYRLIRHLGPWAAYPLLYPVVFYYSCRPSVRNRSRPYLRRRFPGSGFFRSWVQAFRLNLVFALVLLERAILGLKGRMEFQDPEGGGQTVENLLAEGRGLIMLTAHVGAWQTGLGWFHGGVQVNIVQRRQEQDVDLHYFEHERTRRRSKPPPGRQSRLNPEIRPPRIINAEEPAAALAAVTSALLGGEIVCLMGDRVRAEDGLTVPVSFLGGTIALPGAPFYLAAKTGAPLAVVFTRRLGPSKVAGEIRRVIRTEAFGPIARTADSIKPLAQEFADCLEEYVRENPYQFFNFYDLWVKDE